jgi:hypothetical protein
VEHFTIAGNVSEDEFYMEVDGDLRGWRLPYSPVGSLQLGPPSNHVLLPTWCSAIKTVDKVCTLMHGYLKSDVGMRCDEARLSAQSFIRFYWSFYHNKVSSLVKSQVARSCPTHRYSITEKCECGGFREW